ncbi:MAG: glycoside hydrolase family 127 protein [Bacteroidales bacterium]|nr:glycoside hydrolase family 127 protein [Bacteroidales bacterium]
MKQITLLISILFVAGFTSCSQQESKKKVQPVIPIQAESFELSQVELKEGVLHDAMETNTQTLLDFEADRFLAWFRKEAGLEPKAEVYGGWESDGYILSGHSLGHHISALAKQYNATGDPRFKGRLDYIIDELALVQEQHGNGYIGAIPEADELWQEISKGELRPEGFQLNDVNVPWYNLDKMYNGLKDAYLLGDNDKAYDVVAKFTDWAYELTKNLDEEQWQTMLSVEYGGMIHSLADIYSITGDPKHLELAKKFYHHDVLDPLAERRDELDGLHANTQIPKVRGVARIHELTDNPKYHTIATYFWDQVVHAHTYVNGGNSSSEHFGKPHQLSDRLKHTTETCNTHNMLWLTNILFSWEPGREYMDYYERALFNHLLASHNPETGMYKYKGYLDMPARKGFSSLTHSFWCCVGSGMEIHTSYGRDIYHKSGDKLYVNLFAPSKLNWSEQDVTIEQTTNFPYESSSQLSISSGKSKELGIMIREPQWYANDFQIKVNGEAQELGDPENGYHEIRRSFDDGDVIEVSFSHKNRIETMPDNENRIAFFHGPVLLNAILHENPDRSVMENKPEVPELKGTKQELLAAMEPVPGEDLHFVIPGAGRQKNKNTGRWEKVDIYLKPHFSTVQELYSVYMDIQL